jgi:hypothetical protein
MAATVIDTLVISLGLDTRQFTEEQRQALDSLRKFQEAAATQAKQTESQTRRLTDTLMSFRREAIGTLATIFGATSAKEFLNYVTNLDASTGRLAKQFGNSTRELSIWQGIVTQVGGSAQSANAAIGGLNAEMVRFDQTGQSSILGVLNQLNVGFYKTNGQLKTATELIFDVTEAIEKKGINARQASGLLNLMGISGDMVNVILKGTSALREYYRAAEDAGSASDESAAAAEKYQKSLALLERSATNTGRSLATTFMPAITAVLDAFRKLNENPPEDKKTLERLNKLGIDTSPDRPANVWERMLSRLTGLPVRGRQYKLGVSGYTNVGASSFDEAGFTGLNDAAPLPGPFAGAGGGRPSASEMEAYIRKAAVARGIDPNTAVQVAKSEGLFAYGHSASGQSFVPGEQSFGPFQLNYGPTGLGTRFTRQTGLDARNASTWPQQVDFSLDQARSGGWGPWHGWKGLPFAGIQRGGAGGSGGSATTVTIDKIEVNAPRATDAEGIGQEIGPALKRAVGAAAANFGAI